MIRHLYLPAVNSNQDSKLLDLSRRQRKILGMLPFEPEEFGLSIRCDNRLLAQRIASGEAIELYEVVELMAWCRCLFDLASLTAREMETIRDCLVLWESMQVL